MMKKTNKKSLKKNEEIMMKKTNKKSLKKEEIMMKKIIKNH